MEVRQWQIKSEKKNLKRYNMKTKNLNIDELLLKQICYNCFYPDGGIYLVHQQIRKLVTIKKIKGTDKNILTKSWQD